MVLLRKGGRDAIAKVFTGTDLNGSNLATSGWWLYVGSGTGSTDDPSVTHLTTTATCEGYEWGGWAGTMESGYPILSTSRMTYRTIATTCEAAVPWNEWGMAWTTASSESMFNRKNEDPSLGTKTTDQTWQLTVDVEITT